MDHVEMFAHGDYNCAESALAGVTESLESVNLASGFGGGIGRSGATCGAVTGAVMALGAVMAVRREGSETSYARLQNEVKKLLDQFASEFGSTLCRELIPYDLNAPDQKDSFLSQPDGRNRCQDYVARAVELARQILDERGLGAAS